MQDFKNLKVWQLGHQFVLNVYQKTQRFPKEELFGLTSQFRRAALSIPANISEGTGKYSSNDTARYFQISLGSAKECEYYLILSKDLNYLSIEDFDELNSTISEIRAILITLIKRNRLNEEQEIYLTKDSEL
jgi:four helix bundle protein